ncbi:hypothetical protein C8T65DRAFT_280306 [Cerioporus squamosus]|nr:hypothetical protein C8T65DRAFT_280306 [Cerioporus squamosus]
MWSSGPCSVSPKMVLTCFLQPVQALRASPTDGAGPCFAQASKASDNRSLECNSPSAPREWWVRVSPTLFSGAAPPSYPSGDDLGAISREQPYLSATSIAKVRGVPRADRSARARCYPAVHRRRSHCVQPAADCVCCRGRGHVTAIDVAGPWPRILCAMRYQLGICVLVRRSGEHA